MDGECGHTWDINLDAKPGTKKPTNSIIQRALSSAASKSHGKGFETFSALEDRGPLCPVAPAHPQPDSSKDEVPVAASG